MFGRFIDPELLLRTYRDPLAWVSLVADVLPVIGVIVFGWGAVPLVALYWLENLVVGVFNVLRMWATGLAHPSRWVAGVFLSVFFTVHYGMFCFVHGVFLRSFDAVSGSSGMESPIGLVNWALSTGPQLPWFVVAIIGVNALFFAVDYLGRRQFERGNPAKLLFQPYGRIVTLHIAILLGGGLAVAMGEPLLGVLFLIVLRVIFGVALSVFRRLGLDKSGDAQLAV